MSWDGFYCRKCGVALRVGENIGTHDHDNESLCDPCESGKSGLGEAREIARRMGCPYCGEDECKEWEHWAGQASYFASVGETQMDRAEAAEAKLRAVEEWARKAQGYAKHSAAIGELLDLLSPDPVSGECSVCGSDDPDVHGFLEREWRGGEVVRQVICSDPFHNKEAVPSPSRERMIRMIQTFQSDEDGQWYNRIIAANNEILAVSEGFPDRKTASDNIDALMDAVPDEDNADSNGNGDQAA